MSSHLPHIPARYDASLQSKLMPPLIPVQPIPDRPFIYDQTNSIPSYNQIIRTVPPQLMGFKANLPPRQTDEGAYQPPGQITDSVDERKIMRNIAGYNGVGFTLY